MDNINKFLDVKNEWDRMITLARSEVDRKISLAREEARQLNNKMTELGEEMTRLNNIACTIQSGQEYMAMAIEAFNELMQSTGDNHE